MIVDQLEQIADDSAIDIVNARQHGSRMYGVSNENSDWDVLFLFSQDPVVYATNTDYIGTIDRSNDDIDCHGWNIDKFVEMVRESNPTAVEYCRPDPTEYISYDGITFDELARDLRNNFNRLRLYYHYISMAGGIYERFIETGTECTKNRQFHVARGVACAQYIRKTNELPPMDVLDLIESDKLRPRLGEVLSNLAKEKDRGNGDQHNPDIIGPLLEEESDINPEPTDERTQSPDPTLGDAFITDVLE